MGLNQVVISLFIGLGTVIMCLAVFGTRDILALVQTSRFRRSWRVLFFLMAFFAAGYIATIFFVLLDFAELMMSLTGVIFLFGALFVYIVVRIGYLTIEELTNTQASLTKARDQALEASRLKSELLARVSHELRTPLHAILGYADMLNSEILGSVSDKQRQTIARIAVNTDKLIEDINSLLRQAQLEAGHLRLKNAPFSVAALRAHVEDIIRPLAAQKELELVTEIAPDLPATLVGDVQRLQEIGVNLAGNAVKFTEQGRVSVRFERPDAHHWAIKIADTGPGIPAEAMPTIFEPFRQVDGSATRRYGGTGLGLSIVKQLVEMMAGNLHADSDVGRGTTFTVTFPLILTLDEVQHDEAVSISH